MPSARLANERAWRFAAGAGRHHRPMAGRRRASPPRTPPPRTQSRSSHRAKSGCCSLCRELPASATEANRSVAAPETSRPSSSVPAGTSGGRRPRAAVPNHSGTSSAIAAATAATTATAAADILRAAAIAVDGSHVCTNGPARLGIAGLTSRQITHVPVCAVSAGPLPRWRRMSSRKDCRRRGGINAWIAACRHERGYGRRWWR